MGGKPNKGHLEREFWPGLSQDTIPQGKAPSKPNQGLIYTLGRWSSESSFILFSASWSPDTIRLARGRDRDPTRVAEIALGHRFPRALPLCKASPPTTPLKILPYPLEHSTNQRWGRQAPTFAVGSTIVAVSYAVGADDEERLQLRKIPSEIMIHWNKGEAAFPVEKGKEISPHSPLNMTKLRKTAQKTKESRDQFLRLMIG